MNPIYRISALREIERSQGSASGVPSPLMEQAGLWAAGFARDKILDSGKAVLVLAGPGNNGGDALVMARWLRQWRYDVTVVQPRAPAPSSVDALSAYEAWSSLGGSTIPEWPHNTRWDLVVDGLFGVGLSRRLESPFAELVSRANAYSAPLVSLDVPSGLNSETGEAGDVTIHAGHTLTFIGYKPGLLTRQGRDHVGQLHLATLGCPIPKDPAVGRTIEQGTIAGLVPLRRHDTHKGSFGRVGVIGGAESMEGALFLSARAALKLGAGRVYAAAMGSPRLSVDTLQPEIMWNRPRTVIQDEHMSVLAVGPGLGRAPEARDTVDLAIRQQRPLVADADALNEIAAHADLATRLKDRTAPTILTPHPMEAARLLYSDVDYVQNHRIDTAQALAATFRAHVLLKGSGAICADPHGRWWINTSGNPGLAAPGTGDVLTGIIAALMAQGLAPGKAILTGAYLHGAAADELVQAGTGPVGLTASELIDAARALLNKWIYNTHRDVH